MQHICFTHVDADTKIPCTVEPMRTGPSFPDVKGLEVLWWDESAWPTYEPKFYGTCDDDADVTIAGVLQVLSAEEFEQLRLAEMDARWELLKSRLQEMVMGGLDGMAAAHGYEGIDAVIAEIESGDPEKEADALYCAQLKQNALDVVDQFIHDVETGVKPRPDGPQEVIELLPELKWRGEA